jgi:hypothetical protein
MQISPLRFGIQNTLKFGSAVGFEIPEATRQKLEGTPDDGQRHPYADRGMSGYIEKVKDGYHLFYQSSGTRLVLNSRLEVTKMQREAGSTPGAFQDLQIWVPTVQEILAFFKIAKPNGQPYRPKSSAL